jgi:hypothetical protein
VAALILCVVDFVIVDDTVDATVVVVITLIEVGIETDDSSDIPTSKLYSDPEHPLCMTFASCESRCRGYNTIQLDTSTDEIATNSARDTTSRS